MICAYVCFAVSLPCPAPLFSCRSGTRCALMDWVLDGNNDCIDGSDEGLFHNYRMYIRYRSINVCLYQSFLTYLHYTPRLVSSSLVF